MSLAQFHLGYRVEMTHGRLASRQSVVLCLSNWVSCVTDANANPFQICHSETKKPKRDLYKVYEHLVLPNLMGFIAVYQNFPMISPFKRRHFAVLVLLAPHRVRWSWPVAQRRKVVSPRASRSKFQTCWTSDLMIFHFFKDEHLEKWLMEWYFIMINTLFFCAQTSGTGVLECIR